MERGNEEMEHQVLEGIKVVDFSVMHLGPYAAAMLGELGAEVIHVEDRQGEWTRGLKSFSNQPLIFKGRHIQVEQFNTNKRGLAIDLKKPASREVMHRLIGKSDVFLSNYQVEPLRRFELDYETLRKLNPRIIYAHATAFGEEGPLSDVPGYELVGYARSGIMLSTNTESGEPVQPALGLGDRIGAISLAWGTLAALMARERFGIGQKVTTSFLGALISQQSWSTMCALIFGSYGRVLRKKVTNPLYSWYRCKDNVWVALTIIYPPTLWAQLCNALGVPELANDPRYDTAEKRAERNTELIRLLDEIFASKRFDEWETALKENGLPFSRVNDLTDLASDPQVLANKYVIEWDHPYLGKIKFPGFPYNLSETPPSLRMAAPEVGQHNEEILLELGYSWDDIQKLRNGEVI